VLENPPKDRYPVSTFVMEYNTEVIAEAILREAARAARFIICITKWNRLNVPRQNKFNIGRLAGSGGQAKCARASLKT
jgi:hypothetical protein